MPRLRNFIRYLGLAGIERAEAASLSYGGQRLLDMGLALATRPRILLLDEPLAGLAVAERERIAKLIKTISAEIPVLLVEHDIDRVFRIADHVTVMNDGAVLVDGSVDDARNNEKVREIYIGSGAAAVAMQRRAVCRECRKRCSWSTDRYLLRQEPHPQCRLARRARARDRCLARSQRRRQIDFAEDADRYCAAGKRARSDCWQETRPGGPPP